MFERFHENPNISPESDPYLAHRHAFARVIAAVEQQDYDQMVEDAQQQNMISRADMVEAMNTMRVDSPDAEQAKRWEVAIGEYVHTFSGQEFQEDEAERINTVIRELKKDTSAGRLTSDQPPTEEYPVAEDKLIFGLSDEEQEELRGLKVFRDIEFEIEFSERTPNDFAKALRMVESSLNSGEINIDQARKIRMVLDRPIVSEVGKLTLAGSASQLDRFHAKTLTSITSSPEVGRKIRSLHGL